MDLSSLVGLSVSLLLALVSSWAILKPFFQTDASETFAGLEIDQSSVRREIVLQELEELEADFHAKKVEQADYVRLKDELIREAAECTARVEQQS